MTKSAIGQTRLFVFGWVVVVLGGMRFLYQLMWELRVLDGAAPFLTIRIFAWLQIFLLLSLLLVGLGLAFRSKKGLGCSILGLIGVLFGYVGWYHYSNQTLKMLTNELILTRQPEIVPPNSFGLIRGQWWDIAILLCSVILIIWELKILLARRQASPV